MKKELFTQNGILPHLIWAAIGALAAFVITLVFNVTGLTALESFQNTESPLYNVSNSIWVLIAIYCFATPIIEEIIFRYFIFWLLIKHIKKAAVAIILTAALFGLYHLHPVQILYGFLMGLLITYSYYVNRRLTIPIVVHAAANAVALAFTFI